MRSRGWCFTLNNYEWEEYNYLQRQLECQYLVFGHEIAPKTGTPHLQGYVYFENAKSFERVQKLLPRCRIDAQKGTNVQASDYCKEDGHYYEYGTLPDQGKRTDVETIIKMAKEGKTVMEILDEVPSGLRMLNAINDVKAMMPTGNKCQVIKYWGEADVTQHYYDIYGNNVMFIDMMDELSDYQGQAVVVFRGHVSLERVLLDALIGIPLRIKKGYQWIKVLPPTIVFTNGDYLSGDERLKYEPNIDGI